MTGSSIASAAGPPVAWTTAAVSLGSPRDVADRARSLLARHRLVVAGLPTGTEGDRALDRLIATRSDDTLLIAMQTPPDAGSPQLLPVGIVGLGDPGPLIKRV